MRLSVYILSRETAGTVLSAVIPEASNPIWEKRYSQKGRLISKQNYKSWKNNIQRLVDKPLTVKEIKRTTDIPGTVIKPVLNRVAFEGSLIRVGATSGNALGALMMNGTVHGSKENE